MLQLLKNLRSYSQGKEITDTDILNWANRKVKSAGRKRQMESFKVIDKQLTVIACMMVSLFFFEHHLKALYFNYCCRIKVFQMECSFLNF